MQKPRRLNVTLAVGHESRLPTAKTHDLRVSHCTSKTISSKGNSSSEEEASALGKKEPRKKVKTSKLT